MKEMGGARKALCFFQVGLAAYVFIIEKNFFI